MVLSLFLHFIRNGGEDGLSLTEFEYWPNVVVAYAEKHSIEISGVYGITNAIFPAEDLDDEILALVNKNGAAADKWKLKSEWVVFARKHATRGGKLGGNEFDILKMTKRERIEAAFDRKDPVPKMPKAPAEEVPTDDEDGSAGDDEWEDVEDDEDDEDD